MNYKGRQYVWIFVIVSLFLEEAVGLVLGANNVCSSVGSRQTCTGGGWLGRRRCSHIYWHNLSCCAGWATAADGSASCDVNVATCDSYPCQHGGGCVNGRDAYTCNCQTGYVGTNCEHFMQSCNSSPCDNGGTCTNGVDTYSCTCNVEWSGPHCEVFMRSCNSGPCRNGGTCSNEPNTYSCVCGLRWTGPTCQSSAAFHCDERSIDNGLVSGTSFYFDDVIIYSCESGYNLTDGDTVRMCVRSDGLSGYWTGTEPRCAYVRSCDSGPCTNGATCVNNLDSYTCLCDHGWSGTHCEFDIAPPKYDQCPENITQYISVTRETVTWQPPEFFDTHGESEVYVTAQNYPEPQATLGWGEYIMQYAALKPSNGLSTECTFSTAVYPIPCTLLTSPINGAIACNGWNSRFGAICMLFCESTRDITLVRIEEVYVCGASGSWSAPLPENADCSEIRSNLTAESQSAERQRHYYDGQCSEASAQATIRQSYIDTLMSHEMAPMCTSDRFIDQCIPDNVEIFCN